MVKNMPANAGDARHAGSIPGLGRSSGGGHGSPLQYFYLGNPMDRGAWPATVHGVTKSRTQLSTQACNLYFPIFQDTYWPTLTCATQFLLISQLIFHTCIFLNSILFGKRKFLAYLPFLTLTSSILKCKIQELLTMKPANLRKPQEDGKPKPAKAKKKKKKESQPGCHPLICLFAKSIVSHIFVGKPNTCQPKYHFGVLLLRNWK